MSREDLPQEGGPFKQDVADVEGIENPWYHWSSAAVYRGGAVPSGAEEGSRTEGGGGEGEGGADSKIEI